MDHDDAARKAILLEVIHRCFNAEGQRVVQAIGHNQQLSDEQRRTELEKTATCRAINNSTTLQSWCQAAPGSEHDSGIMEASSREFAEVLYHWIVGKLAQ